MAIIKCPKCNKDISDKSLKCINCGYILKEEKPMFCSDCGAKINKGDNECSNCGCPVYENNNTNDKLQKVEVTKIKFNFFNKKLC